MNKQDILNYFTLNSQLYETVSNWIKNKTSNTFYQNRPFTINNITKLNDIQLEVNVDFQVPPMNDYVEEIYNVTIEELENY